MSNDVLPTEVLQFIFSFTTWKDQTAISLVCRRWASVVEPLMLARTCLKVSHYDVRRIYRDGIDDVMICYKVVSPDEFQLRLIDQKLLTNSNRSYTCLRVQWTDERTETEQNVKALQEILDVCQERFPVQRLYLRGPLCGTLTNLLTKHHRWLESLTELNFEEYSTMNKNFFLAKATIELSLPKLKQLTWLEFSGYQKYENRFYNAPWDQSFYHYNFYELNVTLHVPELYRLKMRVNKKDRINPLAQSVTDASNCYLFHPNLNLKYCSKLQHIDVSELGYLDQFLASLSESLLQQLKTLTLFNCDCQAIHIITGKCSNLEELIVDKCHIDYRIFQTSAVLSHSLKKLTLRTFDEPFNSEEAAFPELRYLSLTLVAPKLTTLEISRSAYDRMRIVHIDQIRTMIVHLQPARNMYRVHLPPPPNITELVLYQREAPEEDEGSTMIQDYLNLHSNLRRLSVYGSRLYRRIELSLKNLPNLEYFFARHLTFRLTDFHELTELKTLILSYCSIKTTSGDAEVKLTALECMRVECVVFEDIVKRELDNHAWEHFPILCGNERQPPVVNCKGVFDTPTQF